LFLFFFSCMSAPQLAQETQYDFTTRGFLDDSTFQITASGSPDSSAKGLVAQRESAVIRARNGLQESAVKALTDYRIALYMEQILSGRDKEKKISDAGTYVSAAFRKYLAYGFIAEEYYEKDNSASVVYRISKRGLKKEVEAFAIPINEDKENQK
ncbi:MAG: hypothetical protein ACRCUT_07935, partial [Spirochaetota bacterium]